MNKKHEEIYEKIEWTRKPNSYVEVDTVVKEEELGSLLPLIPSFNENIFKGRAFDYFKIEMPQYFIVERENGERFLVDTQGYDYPRYVSRIEK